MLNVVLEFSQENDLVSASNVLTISKDMKFVYYRKLKFLKHNFQYFFYEFEKDKEAEDIFMTSFVCRSFTT